MTLSDSSIIRFVHAADLHLDSPFTGLGSVAPERVRDALYRATFDAYDNIIELCVNERVDALLIAGDVYDGADRSLRAQRRFIDGLERLDREGIRSFVCHGNHDPLDGWEARLDYPPGCHRFGADFEAAPVFDDAPGRAVVHGISYPTRDVFDNLVRKLGAIDDSPYTIGLLHANVGGNTEHGAYAPCTLDDLAQSGVDYWALGHVHTRQTLSDARPVVVYPGNPQGRHPNETGARGVYLVEVGRNGDARLEFRPIDAVRWERIEVDIAPFESEQALIDHLYQRVQDTLDNAGGRSAVVRVALTGRGRIHDSLRQQGFSEQLAEQLNDAWANRSPFAWCERIEDNSASEFDRRARLEGADFVADMLRLRDQSETDAELRAQLLAGTEELFRHYRYRRYLGDAVPRDDEELAELIAEAEAEAVNLLMGDEAQ